MHVEFRGDHIGLNDRLRDYTIKKLHRLEKHFNHITNTHIYLRENRGIHHAEATVHASASEEIFAQASGPSYEIAVNELIHRLDRQVVKHKERLKNHRVKRNLKDALS